jgi:LPS export ABC transporter protein LptC
MSSVKTAPRTLTVLFLAALLAACSFDYGQEEAGDSSQPDIVMEDVEYVRVRSADPIARFQAERAERYEKRQLMELRNFSFEQFGSHGGEVNASGRAGNASVEIDSGDIRMSGGVRLDVESEDIAIETSLLEWKDKPRTLSTGQSEEVTIYQSNGTGFTGIGFSADARKRTWEFSGGVKGTYIHEDEEAAGEDEEAPFPEDEFELAGLELDEADGGAPGIDAGGATP